MTAELLASRISEERGTPRKIALKQANEYISFLDKIKKGDVEVGGRESVPGVAKENGSLPKFWIDKIFFLEGLSTVVYAPPQTGKTHLGSWLMMRAGIMHPNWDFITNIPFYWVDDPTLSDLAFPNIYSIKSLYELLKKSAESTLVGRIPAVVIDEMDSAVTSQQWREREGHSWKAFTYMEAHLGIQGPLLLYHAWNDIPNYIRKGGNVNIHVKLFNHNGKRHIFEKETFPNDLIVNGPYIPYSRRGWGGIDINVDVQELSKAINVTRKMDVAHAILNNLDVCMIGNDEEVDREKEVDVEYSIEKVRRGRPIQCSKCGYKWEWKGKRKQAKCPNCGHNNTIENIKYEGTEEKEEEEKASIL